MGKEAGGGPPTEIRGLMDRTAEPVAEDYQPPAFAMRLIAGRTHAVEAELLIANGFLEAMGSGVVEELADGQPMLQICGGFDPVIRAGISVGRETGACQFHAGSH